ncbi:MAG TPA: hypothetical protein VGM39_22015 [Kofleriaceae bacterium]
MVTDEEPDEWTKMRRKKWRERFIVAGVLVGLFAILLVYSALTMKSVHTGEACKEPKDCTDARGVCLVGAKSVCSTYCDGPKDTHCPNHGTCEMSDVLDEKGSSNGYEKVFVCQPE